MTDRHARITLAHGNGGRRMRELISETFARALANSHLDTDNDAATVPVEGEAILMTTDGFTVQPLEFPGGDIGTLAVYGTVNDLAVAGAVPRYLCLNVFVEEGFEIARLARIIESAAAAARESGVAIVTGDTKVLPKGGCDGLLLATSGVGMRRAGFSPGMHSITAGDAILVSGPIGDHGTAVMLAREQFGLRGELCSDCADVTPLAAASFDLADTTALRFMRDPSRGGIASVLHEIAVSDRPGRVRERAIRSDRRDFVKIDAGFPLQPFGGPGSVRKDGRQAHGPFLFEGPPILVNPEGDRFPPHVQRQP